MREDHEENDYLKCTPDEFIDRLHKETQNYVAQIKKIEIIEPFTLDPSVGFSKSELTIENCKFPTVDFLPKESKEVNSLIRNLHPCKFRLLQFKNCTFDNISFGALVFDFRLEFKNCIFRSLSLRDSDFQEITISDCTFHIFSLGFCNISRIELNNNTCEHSYIGESGDPNKFSQFIISKGKFDYLYIYNNTFDNLDIRGPIECIEFTLAAHDNRGNQLRSHDEINRFTLRNFDSNIYVLNFKIKKLLFEKSTINKGSVTFDNIEVDELKFFRIVNSRILQILNLRPGSSKARVDMIESSFGRAYIFNSNFQLFSVFNLINTNIEEVKTNSVVWNNTLNETPLVQKIEIFRQLKIQSEKKADKVQALQFEQLEMDAHEQNLKLRKGEWREKIVFAISKYTNEFGQNWWRPTWLLFATAIFFFIVIETIIYYNCYNPPTKENWFDFVIINNWGNLFYFLDPVHKFSDIQSGMQNCSIAKSLDYFSRVFSAFFIIQIISAFRKYYRK